MPVLAPVTTATFPSNRPTGPPPDPRAGRLPGAQATPDVGCLSVACVTTCVKRRAYWRHGVRRLTSGCDLRYLSRVPGTAQASDVCPFPTPVGTAGSDIRSMRRPGDRDVGATDDDRAGRRSRQVGRQGDDTHRGDLPLRGPQARR